MSLINKKLIRILPEEIGKWVTSESAGDLFLLIDNACEVTYEDLDAVIGVHNTAKIMRGPYGGKMIFALASKAVQHLKGRKKIMILINDPGNFLDTTGEDWEEDTYESLGDSCAIINGKFPKIKGVNNAKD